MAVEASRSVSYDVTAALLEMPTEAVKRLALRRSWPRRPGPAGGTLVAVPEAVSGEPADAESDEVEVDWDNARSLLACLEAHVDRFTEELADARTEMRGVRYEAGRAQFLAALVEAERARSAEIKAKRDRLAAELPERRRPWLVRMLLDAVRPSASEAAAGVRTITLPRPAPSAPGTHSPGRCRADPRSRSPQVSLRISNGGGEIERVGRLRQSTEPIELAIYERVH